MIPKSIYVKNDSSENYLSIIKELYNKAIDTEYTEKYSAPFVLFCATSLEYLLNDIFINYANNYFDDEAQKKYAEAFITLGVSVKLLTFLPIISENKYQWNLNSMEYKVLTEIIAKRNKIAHGKDFFQALETTPVEENGFSINLNDLKINTLFSTKNECTTYLKAFESFVNNIYQLIERDELKNSSLIIPIRKKITKSEKLRLEK